MIYHVDFNSMEEYKSELDKNIDIINSELAKLYKDYEGVIWEGAAYEAATNGLYNRLNVLSNMMRILSLISDFMMTVSNNYQEGLEEMKKNFDEILDEIRKEKAKRGIIWDDTLKQI